jgi:hypothetical protein
MADLFDPDEDDWVEFQNHTPEYYLRVASHAIRKYLGWHLSPSKTETIMVPIKQRGIIPLPSRFVTAVSSLEIAGTVMEDDSYKWDQGGWIQAGRYFYDTSRWPTVTSWQANEATVVMTHGYPEVPLEVKQVGFELVETTMATPVSNVSQMSTPAGYRITLSSPPGFYLTEWQQKVLAPYRLFGVT